MARKKSEFEDAPKVKINKKNLKNAARILVYFKPYRKKYFLGLSFLLLTSLTALAFPMLMGKLVDSAKASFIANINRNALFLLILFAAQAIFSFFRVYLFVNVTENTLASLRQATYTHLIKLPMNYFSQHRVGELNSRISSDITMLQDTFTTTIAEFLRQFIIIIGGIAFLAFTSFKLTFVMLGIVPVVAILAVFFGRYIRKMSKETQDEVAASNTIVEETMQGIANVKAFANEFFEIARYKKSTLQIVEKAMKGGKARAAFTSFIIFCLFGSIVAVIWRGVILVHNGEMSVGAMFQFVLYSVFVGASFGGIAELYAQIQKAIGATERIMEILDEETENIDTTFDNKGIYKKISGTVVFKNVDFNYPSRSEIPVLKNIFFEAKRGETIAIVGPSGSGKSTLVSLILRFYNPQSGEIFIDGKNSQEYSLTELRNQMAIVPQDVLLFGGSIRENILYGKPDATNDEVMEAAKKANAHLFIENFPEKYETLVGERGVKLSGGQRQRIAIARAVLKNPSILILDEATSSLDSESERLVQEALDKLMVGRTSFVIAHRLSTVRNADKIIVIDKGELLESGTHEELIKKENGLYRSLSKLQFELS
ncbi:MAG: ABC transporter transmembrane domain-containing protein [Bacteroidia bacterium]